VQAIGRSRAFLRDTRAAVAVTTAICITIIIGMTALAVDLGSAYFARRKAQSAADLAAISAASVLTNAEAAAAATLVSNNLPASALQNVVLGTYTADATIAPANRFQPSAAAAANAVQVTVQTTTPLFFGRILSGSSNATIQTTATATQTAMASFAVGSGLASLNGGLLNEILGGMLGTNLSLSVNDYQSLLGANLQLFDFLPALASRANINAGTYSTLLASNVKMTQFVNAMIDTASAEYGTTSPAVLVLRNVSTAVNGSSAVVPLASLMNAGPYGGLTIGQNPQASATINALNLLSGAAQIANGQQQVAVNLNLNVPGIIAATLQLAIGSPPQGTSWLAVGAAGTTVYTAQTRLLLTVQVAGAGGIASVSVPIYLELATASATLAAVNCGYPDVSTSTVTLNVTPGVLNSWIGNISASAFTNMAVEPNPGPATLVSVPLLTVTGLAHAAITNMSPTPVTFSYSDISAGTMKTVNTTDFVASLVSSLIGNLSIGVSVAGLGLGLPGVIQSTVAGILADAATPIDQVLSSVLATLGIALGQADVWVTGIRCDGAVLVR
jgi:uncharacterized membrane protein